MTKQARENRVPIMMTEDELTAIDDWRFANKVATRSGAIRRLAKMALTVDGMRDQFSDALLAKEEAEDAVFEIAASKVLGDIEAKEDQSKTAEMVSQIQTYMSAHLEFASTLRAMFEEINFFQFSNDPFVDAEHAAEERARTLQAMSKALRLDEEDDV